MNRINRTVYQNNGKDDVLYTYLRSKSACDIVNISIPCISHILAMQTADDTELNDPIAEPMSDDAAAEAGTEANVEPQNIEE